MNHHYRIDDLGGETAFHVLPGLIRNDAQLVFEALLVAYAQGFTTYNAVGNWKGENEEVTVYRVATLSESAVTALIHFLLVNSDMKDLYVVHDDGRARGHCYEEKETWNYASVTANSPAATRVPC